MNTIPFEEAGIDVVHHFSAGLYAKEVTIPSGMVLIQHSHKFDHMSVLASGRAIVAVDGKAEEFIGPAVLNIRAGAVHSVTAITDVVWLCIHATNETDPDKIDHELIDDNSSN